MNTKHTPGPWHVNHGPPTSALVADVYGWHKGSPCHRFSIEAERPLTVRDAERDAHLIAAAPELLHVLIQAVDESGFSLSGPTDWRAAEDGEPPWVCNARAAISLALGKDR